MKIRMVATDLDGTLLSKDKRVSERNRRALLRLEEAGIYAVLASGRKSPSVRDLAVSLGLNSPIISSNGARVDLTPDGPIFLEDTIPRPMASAIYRVLKAHDVYFVIYKRENAYLVNTHKDHYRDERRGVSGFERYPGVTPYLYTEDEERARTEGLIDPYKFIAFSKDPDELAAVRRSLNEETGCAFSSSWADNIEILRPGAGKGRAIRALCDHFEFSVDQVMAFGDYTNDLEMLKTVGMPVAMGNAAAEVKAVAKRVAPDNDHSGVAQVIEELLRS